MLRNALPVGSNLQMCGLLNNTYCDRCRAHETTTHILLHCQLATQYGRKPLSAQTFDRLLTPLSVPSSRTRRSSRHCLPPVSEVYFFHGLFGIYGMLEIFYSFRNMSSSPIDVITKAIASYLEWQEAQTTEALISSTPTYRGPPVPL